MNGITAEKERRSVGRSVGGILVGERVRLMFRVSTLFLFARPPLIPFYANTFAQACGDNLISAPPPLPTTMTTTTRIDLSRCNYFRTRRKGRDGDKIEIETSEGE